MLLYRVIPDQYGMVIDDYDKKHALRRENMTTEDLFYRLGYINLSEHMPYFHNADEEEEKWLSETGEGLSFFTSPWDALFSIPDLNDHKGHKEDGSVSYYSSNAVRILEYDIPDEIVKVSWQRTEEHGIEKLDFWSRTRNIVKVPIELLSDGSIVQEELSDELREELTVMSFIQGNESLDRLAEMVYKDDEKLKNKRNFYVKRAKFFFKYKFLNDDIRKKVDALRLSNAGKFFKSDYITSRELLISKDEYDQIIAKELFQKLFESGMFTHENLLEYRDKQKTKKMEE